MLQQWEKGKEILRRVEGGLKKRGRRMKNAARSLWRLRSDFDDFYDEDCFFWDID
jgi:hypothetical protein